MKNKKLFLMVVGLLLAPLANATFVFSNLQLTNNSVTFTIDGDMTGYQAPSDSSYSDQFSFLYSGDVWTGPSLYNSFSYTPNIWSQSPFDNESFSLRGNTGAFGPEFFYTWSTYSNSLADATASNRQVTVSFANYLDPLANGTLTFLWGNGTDSSRHTVLGSLSTSTSVPEPGALGLFGLGLMSIFFARRRSRALHASRVASDMGI
jgi:hypothetical protein